MSTGRAGLFYLRTAQKIKQQADKRRGNKNYNRPQNRVVAPPPAVLIHPCRKKTGSTQCGGDKAQQQDGQQHGKAAETIASQIEQAKPQ